MACSTEYVSERARCEQSESGMLKFVALLGSAVPMIVVALCTAPAVMNIHLKLPARAQKSEQTLREFLRKPPSTTMVEFTAMRFMPWPKRRTMFLEDLKTVRPKNLRLANLEHVPKANEGKQTPYWLRATMGHYFVRESPRYLKGLPGSGVWPILLQHIRAQTTKKSLG